MKTNLDVTFIPDVIIACCLLHNLFFAQSQENIEQLLEVLQHEENQGMVAQVVDELIPEPHAEGWANHGAGEATMKRLQLGAF